MKFRLYNTLSRTKEDFVPYNPPFVGLYVCGPTVYGDPHLGHARPAVTYDLLFRLLKALDYKVRYVRNITDVGRTTAKTNLQKKRVSNSSNLWRWLNTIPTVTATP